MTKFIFITLYLPYLIFSSESKVISKKKGRSLRKRVDDDEQDDETNIL